ncbi:hypothetical protein QVD17_31097 [Tagetes erecta]|uniref:Uncharacterized protein n=1 Tax=Tagetes erecta TaxID=13708 RepID=A0AAD8K3R0_TARER|nr:hypothetical protein QVD17_31097 [Tagetes erecta]
MMRWMLASMVGSHTWMPHGWEVSPRGKSVTKSKGVSFCVLKQKTDKAWHVIVENICSLWTTSAEEEVD